VRQKRARQTWLQVGLVGLGTIPALGLVLPSLRQLTEGSQGLDARHVEHLAQGSGSWALYFLLLSLAVTPLRRLRLARSLVRVRRTLGLLAFGYAALHLAIWLLDRGADPLRSLVDSITADVSKRPGIALGGLAFAILVPLALTSTQAAIRRLGRLWQRLHRLVYGAALLAVLHVTWQAKAGSVRALLCGAIWLLLMALRLVFWARELRRDWAEESEED
jgi:methionine sulfoxide reductase heme-binding subunit